MRYILVALLLGSLAAALAIYVGLIIDGTLPKPDVEAIARAAVPVANGTASLILGLAIIVIVACAVLAPIIYAFRSTDVLTCLISLVLTTAAIGIFVTAKSSIQEILAVLIYLSNMVLAAIVYAAHRLSLQR